MSEPILVEHTIAGRKHAGMRAIERRNPSNTDEVVALAPEATPGEVAAAVEAASAAFPAWAGASPEVRSDVLDKAGALIFERREALGRLLAREEGKTLPEGIGEVARAARIFKFFAGEALRRGGMEIDSTRPGVEASTLREAVGVFALVTPWNFPIAIPVWKSAPALGFGNTVVLKPSELTPAMAAALADIVTEAGAPAGVFNVVYGGGAAGAALTGDARVKGISFTGSQATGAKIAAVAAARQARVQLEMGGKNPLVILDDADLDRAVQCALDGAYFATGQRCTASSRLIVTAGIHERFVAALAARVQSLKVGDALAQGTQIGPLVNAAALEKSERYLAIAAKEGAKLLAGGGRPSLENPGHYLAPALLSDTTMAMRVNCEEIFGPVASVIRVTNYEEALEAANAGDFGLSAGIMTASLKYAHHFRRNIRAGMVMVNLPTAGVDYHVPFGGVKSSSYGPREQGPAAVEFYTQTKTSYLAV